MTFREKLAAAMQANHSPLCIGLDPDLERLPAHLPRDAQGIILFNQAIIEATADLVCAYKPNIAFYEALGAAGWEALRATLRAVPAHIPTILDAKRGDVGSTARAYAQAAFDELGADAITLSPYLGTDALEPFLQRQDRGCFILCRTSNPGSADLQDVVLANGAPLYQYVARLTAERWNKRGNCGLVVGATFPEELATVRSICPDLPLLVPGVGTQGGDFRAALAAGGTHAIISVSRAIIYASNGRDFADQARQTTYDLQASKEKCLH